MKTLRKILWITILIVLASCKSGNNSYPKSTFDSSFPKRNLNLENYIGEHLLIKSGFDTISLNITCTKKINLITNSKTGDTLFLGKVCKYRGLYYFNEQLNDSSYWIYAVKITDNLIYGLNTAIDQTYFIDDAIENGLYSKLVKYRTSEEIRLHPDKKELKKLFTSILDSISPDTIINFHETSFVLTDTAQLVSNIDPEEFEFITKIYPNPTKDYINIEQGQGCRTYYQIINSKGQVVLNGTLTDTKTIIDLTKKKNGLYTLILSNHSAKKKETIKILKIR